MKYILILVCVAIFGNAYAQLPVANCGDPSVITYSDPVSCADSCATLHANVNSEVSVISGITGDDIYSAVIPIGFNFNFYGTTHTQCVIGSNGVINFNLGLANRYHPWRISAALLGNASARNAICGPWCDVDIRIGGTITYATSGVAPFRRFTATWCTASMYNGARCPGEITTTQIILYETCNLIDVHVNGKTICAAWNAGRAIIGVQNPAGTNAVVPPGRDFNPAYNCTNESWRFTPTGGTSYTVASTPYHPVPNTTGVSWFNGSTFVGSGSTLSCAIPGQTYRADVVGCNGVTISSSTVAAVPPSSNSKDTIDVCLNGTAPYTLPYLGSGYWTLGNSSIATIDSTAGTFTGVSTGTTTYTYNYSQWCTHSIIVNVVNCCSDSCSWITSGNNIYGGNNKFGTLTNDDIRIITNNTDRAIIESGGFMGIKQLSPTTTLDVDCVPPSSIPSGLRLENLPTGPGNALVVDANGYVHKAISTLAKPGGDYSDLEKRLEELERKVDHLLSLLGESSGFSMSNALSVTPNPNNGRMNVAYKIDGNFEAATIKIIDVNGRVIQNNSINGNSGNLSVELPASNTSGHVIITMVVDGKVLAQEKVVLVK